MGVKVGHTRRDGRTVWLTEAATRPSELRHKCPFQGCGLAFKRSCELANHRKGHSGTFMSTPLTSMAAVQAEMSGAQLKAAREVHVKFIIDDILASVISEATFIGGWKSAKVDGRKGNRGSDHRKIRSPLFKRSVINDYERLCQQFPESVDDMPYLVSLKWCVSSNQVNTWFRNRVAILAAATALKLQNGRYVRARSKKGRFYVQEREVFRLFKEHRAIGRRVGPRWLRTTMKRLVKKLDTTTSRLFTASQGWLWRFTKRWRISLRRKSNVKRKPITEREPLLTRYYATLRLHKQKRSKQLDNAEPVWGYYPKENHWSLDQVPAGLLDPRSTYEQTGGRQDPRCSQRISRRAQVHDATSISEEYKRPILAKARSTQIMHHLPGQGDAYIS